MILVLLGSQKFKFDRLVNEIQRLISEGIINDMVIIQAGATKCNNDLVKSFSFIDTEELEKLYDKAELIITHGGSASIMKGLKKDKRVIAVPRKKQYKESVDDHQEQIIKEFEQKGYLIACYNVYELEEKIKYSKNFKLNNYVSNKSRVIQYLRDYINSN